MSDKELTTVVKRFVQKRLEQEYGFAPALSEIVIMECGYSPIDGMSVYEVNYAAVTMNGKYYSITWAYVDRLPQYDIER